jgi:hypothetical protein
MNRILRACACLALPVCLGACSTVRGDFHQMVEIDAQDAQNRPVNGMQCQVGSGSSAIHVVTPATEVRVRRAMQSLAIECHRDSLVATATVKSRRERMEEALLPFGSAGVFIDHVSGALYSYPTTLHLRVGQHVVLEHGGEAVAVRSEPLAPPAAAGQRVEVALAQPRPVGAAIATPTAQAGKTAQAASDHKPKVAGSAKADHNAARPVKKSGAGGTPPHAPTPPAIVTVHSAPVNW